MTDRLTTEDFANRKRDDNEPAEYHQPAENVENYDTATTDPTGYERDAADRGEARDGTVYDDTTYDNTAQHDTTRGGTAYDETAQGNTVQGDTAQDEQYVDHDEHHVEQEQPATPQARSDDEPLFASDEADGYRTEWRTLQADFVDDPRDAVRRADELVAQVVQSLATTFADHKRSLEGQWQQGEEVDTEELRMALRRYRSFFDRLLSV